MIKSSELHLMVGRLVRIVYAVDRGISGGAVVVDDMITPPVLLKDYDPTTQAVTFQRRGSTALEKLVPKEVLPVE
ncbi:hypothetical protein [Anaeromyxobacter dehalogenans]|uniref:hypothetical protein n=1 Tax=Anaeromyxobacter dehalogenans TaxID=161493 RepID=UPI00059C0B6E|nr:hypothetical protein [Anaeromyxobacter dehalogenans]